MIRVVVVDDQAIVREGIRLLLSLQEGIEVVGEAEDGVAALAVARSTAPDVVVMDVRMPGVDGIAATRTIVDERAVAPEVQSRVLVLTTFRDDDVVYGALRAGASGFLVKDSPPGQLVQAVRAVAGGDAWIDPSVAERVIAALRSASAVQLAGGGAADLLTPREREALVLLAQGLSNREICDRWVVSEATVKTHVSRILLKTGCRDRAAAVAFAYRHGFVVAG